MRSKQAPSRLPLKIVREILGPGRTIAQGKPGTQGKIAKKARKIAVFWRGVWKSPLKTRLESTSESHQAGEKGFQAEFFS